MTKVGEITVNGRQVPLFKPPHDEPDFLWVDAEELARAFLPKAKAKRALEAVRTTDRDTRRYSTARNGDRIATIVCHSMAQGLCHLVDFIKGDRARDDDDPGPAHNAYSSAFAMFSAVEHPMSFDEIAHAFRNNGGKFMRGF